MLLAVAGHAALLLAPWDTGQPGRPAGAPSGPTLGQAGGPVTRVRLLSPDDRAEPAPVGPVVSATASATSGDLPVHVQAPRATLAAAGAASQADGAAVAAASADDEALFLVRSQLDRAPYASGPVDLAYPDEAPLGHYQAVMTLFVDEAGRVLRVRLDAASVLPPLLEDAARQAFLQARFEPGRKDGAAVRSRLKVAVEFGADPAPASAPAGPAASR